MGRNRMMAFALDKGVFVCHIKLPVISFNARFTDFNDSIAVYMFEFLESKIKLWTLDDEACLRGSGVEASWTLMLSNDVGVELVAVEGLFNNVEFLVMAGSGERLLYDPRKRRTRGVPPAPVLRNCQI